MNKKERVIDHMDIFLGSSHPWGVKPNESDYKDALAFMKRHILAELGWEVEGGIIYEEEYDADEREENREGATV